LQAVTLRFGTDGVRGVANLDLTPELVVALGRAAARVLGGDCVVIGRDTRISGPLLESALASGFAAGGVHVELMGVVPTPAVSSAETDLSDLRVAVDCANGAASVLAPFVLRRLGINPSVIHAAPNGTNINEGCGSTHPDDLQRAVVEDGADIGLAFDGDADRL